MSANVSTAALTAAIAAANAAAIGSQDAAYLDSLISAIGANYKRVLRRDGSTVWTGTASGSLTRTGSTLNIAAITANASADADIDTGTWTHRIEKASDATVYIESEVGPTGSGKPGILSNDLVSGASATLSAATMSGPGFDTATNGILTLTQAYAAVGDLNSFPPGNLQSGTWPRSAVDFPDSPYGMNQDQMYMASPPNPVGPQEGVIVSRTANRFLLFCWIMPPKNELTPVGNWRVQIRDVQVATKVGTLTNSWNRFYGPSQAVSYGLNNLGSLRTSGNITDSANTSVITLYDMNNAPLETRTEASGGISMKNVGTATNLFQVEVNIPDGNPSISGLPSTVTDNNTKALAAVFWGRLIPDTGSGPIPSNIRLGGLLGIDFYNDTGRLGNPGWSRLQAFDTNWRPIVMAFALRSDVANTPMSPSALATWLSANPPPFT